jgi:tetratricopeptide (TPR) repeat protein
MQSKPWLVAALLAWAPHPADANVLERANELLGQAGERIVQGRYRQAEPLLRRAIEMNRDLPRAHYDLGVVLRETNRLEEAVDEYRIALHRFDARDEAARSQCLYGVALAEESIGRPTEAARAWQEYISFARGFAIEQPAVAIARTHLAREQRLAGVRQSPPGTRQATR